MSDWFQMLREHLQLAHISTPEATVPFGIEGIASQAWRMADMQRAGDAQWVLTAHTGDGAEVQWNMRVFPDTRAEECWGSLTNRGSRPLRNLSECLTWDLGSAAPVSLRRAMDPSGERRTVPAPTSSHPMTLQ